MKSPPSLGRLGMIVPALRFEICRSMRPLELEKVDPNGDSASSEGLVEVGVVPERFLEVCKSSGATLGMVGGGGLRN